MTSPPGWYPDPRRRHEYRWWDGLQWTDHAASGGSRVTDPVELPPPVATARTHQVPPAGAGWRPPAGSAASGEVARPLNGKAVASLVVAIASLPTLVFAGMGVIGAIAAIVLGIIAHREIRRSPDQTGDGLAIGGIVIGSLVLVLAALFVASLLVWSRVSTTTITHDLRIQPGSFGAVSVPLPW